MNQIRIHTHFLPLGLLAGLALNGCKPSAGPGGQMMMQRPPARVMAVTAITQDVPLYLDEIGKTVSIEVVSIVPQVGGKIISAPVEDGANVRKGQLLFEIDPRPLQASLDAARALLAQATATVSMARSDFDRVKGLQGTQAVSQQDIEQKQTAMLVADAQVKSAESAVQQASLNLEYSKIYSPIDGRAGAKLVVAGNVVKANDAPLLVIQRLDPIYAEFKVTENDLGTVRKFIASRGLESQVGFSPEKGLPVEVDVPGDSEAITSALGPAVASATTAPTTRPIDQQRSTARVGKLTFLDNAVQPTSGTIKVRATVANTDNYFWPGQFVNVRVLLMTKKNAVLVPVIAQQIGQQGPYVYVVTSNNIAQIRPITPGQKQGDMLVIASGVQAGEKVIISGQMTVTPDGPVQVINDPPQSPPTTGATSGR